MLGTEDDFIFIFSIYGDVSLWPNCDFYGSVAAGGDVDTQPGSSVELTDPFNQDTGECLVNFPLLEGMKGTVKVITWNIE